MARLKIYDNIVALLEQLDNVDPGSVQAIGFVLSERLRQINVEGRPPADDDQYQNGELSFAGAAYAEHAGKSDGRRDLHLAGDPPSGWPWPKEWWKPKARMTDWSRGAALILSDMARVFRAIDADVTRRKQAGDGR